MGSVNKDMGSTKQSEYRNISRALNTPITEAELRLEKENIRCFGFIFIRNNIIDSSAFSKNRTI